MAQSRQLQPLASPAPIHRIEANDGQRRVLLADDSVEWIEAARNYVKIHVGDHHFLKRITISAFEAELEGRGFVRIHRSVIVPRARVRDVRADGHGDFHVTLDTGVTLRMSRTYRGRLA